MDFGDEEHDHAPWTRGTVGAAGAGALAVMSTLMTNGVMVAGLAFLVLTDAPSPQDAATVSLAVALCMVVPMLVDFGFGIGAVLGAIRLRRHREPGPLLMVVGAGLAWFGVRILASVLTLSCLLVVPNGATALAWLVAFVLLVTDPLYSR